VLPRHEILDVVLKRLERTGRLTKRTYAVRKVTKKALTAARVR
jgi:hypothetical protein